MKKFVVGFCAALALAGSYVAAQDWGTLATISSTLGVSANRLCIGEGFRISDIGCPAYAPTVAPDGLLSVTHVSASGSVSVTGAVSADKFIGDGSELSGISVDGDRVTSGTLAVIANSETSYVSLSSAGTTWGYLGNVNSFLPRLGSNHVSSSLISTTYIQLNSATEVIVCGAQFTGAMRYISGTMQVCDGNNWSNVGGSIPGGTISAFEAATCPSGWTEYTPARGRFLRGLDNGAGNDPDWPRVAGSAQGDQTASHLHVVDPPTGTSANGNHNHSYTRYSGQTKRASGGSGNFWNSSSNQSTGSAGNHNHTVNIGAFNSASTGGAETRPTNVAVIFCQYAAFNATLEAGIATLASLSDVSIGGATLDQVLTFDGASWVPSDTASTVNAMDDLSDVDTSVSPLAAICVTTALTGLSAVRMMSPSRMAISIGRKGCCLAVPIVER